MTSTPKQVNSLLNSLHQPLQYKVFFSSNQQLFSVILEDQNATVEEAIVGAVESFNEQFSLELVPDANLYDLYGAKKSGKKKDDLPSFQKSQILKNTNIKNFHLFCLFNSTKLQNKRSSKSIQTQITLNPKSKQQVQQNQWFGCFCMRKGSLYFSEMSQPLNPFFILTHLLTLLLTYAYLKQQLTFNFIWVLSPTIIVLAYQKYQLCKNQSGLKRAKYVIVGLLLLLFFITLSKAIKNEGGMTGGFDDNKWIVRHRRCFQLFALSLFIYAFLTLIDPQRPSQKSLVKQILLNIFSNLSMPLTICSGGACNSIYISTVTSILSSFSMPLTMVVPFLNAIGYVLQLLGLFSLYTANKWRSYAFWIYFVGMGSQLLLPQWVGVILMIIAVLINAKINQFVYGKKIFKESVL